MEGKTAILSNRVGGRMVARSPYAVASFDDLLFLTPSYLRGGKVPQIAGKGPLWASRDLRKIEQITNKNQEK